MDIQEAKEKVQSLYDDLKKEVDGTFTPTGVYLPPSRFSYYRRAEALVNEVINYAKLDDSIILEHVLHTFDKEVSYVYNYDGKRKSEKKQ